MAIDDDLDPDHDRAGEPADDPDAEPTPAERARARSFADIVDKAIAGRAPAAMSADDRALIEVATTIRASAGRVALAPGRQAAVVEAALRAAVDRAPHGIGAAPGPRIDAMADSMPDAPAPASGSSGELAARRSRLRRAAPWAVAVASSAIAAAAAVALWIGRPVITGPAPMAEVPAAQRSRPADAVVGRIPRERAGDAADRIDAIYADRLSSYRERTLGGAR